MNILFHIIGFIIAAASFIVLLCNWADDRTNLLNNVNNVLTTLCGGFVVGIVIVIAPLLLVPKPIVTFDFSNGSEYATRTINNVTTYGEVNGTRIPIGEMAVKESEMVPMCYVGVNLTHPYVLGYDTRERITITGKRCSEVDSFLTLPQVATILSGWGVTINQINIPVTENF